MNLQKEILQNIEIEDLVSKPQIKDIAELIGIEATRTLIELYNGVSIYIPRVTYWDGAVKKVLRKEEYRKLDIQKIAKELNLSERSVRDKLKNWIES